jgi:hypothetical protein
MNRNRRSGLRLARNVLIAAVVLLAVGAGLVYYKHQFEQSHDLGVIGNGRPTVVQIHDPECPSCRQLLQNLRSATRHTGDELQVRIARIDTAQGRRLAREHSVGHVTLLLFDGQGKLSRVLSGVRDVAELRAAFAEHLERHQKADRSG